MADDLYIEPIKKTVPWKILRSQDFEFLFEKISDTTWKSTAIGDNSIVDGVISPKNSTWGFWYIDLPYDTNEVSIPWEFSVALKQNVNFVNSYIDISIDGEMLVSESLMITGSQKTKSGILKVELGKGRHYLDVHYRKNGYSTDTFAYITLNDVISIDKGEIITEPVETAIWQTPKTDWTVEDRFNFKDYNRIRNNLFYLHKEVSALWEKFSIQGMGEEIDSYKASWRVRYFNAFEVNLELINQSMLTQNYGFRQTFYQNGIFIGFNELNRIENAILQMKQIIDGKKAGKIRLSFRCGGPKGLRI